MTIRRRLMTIGIAAAVIEAALGGWVLAAGGPGRIGLYLITCAIVTLGATAALYWLLGLPPRDEGDGGLEVGENDTPPPWWPQFERDLREYERDRRSGRDQPTVRS
jgi:hypothetical protein